MDFSNTNQNNSSTKFFGIIEDEQLYGTKENTVEQRISLDLAKYGISINEDVLYLPNRLKISLSKEQIQNLIEQYSKV